MFAVYQSNLVNRGSPPSPRAFDCKSITIMLIHGLSMLQKASPYIWVIQLRLAGLNMSLAQHFMSLASPASHLTWTFYGPLSIWALHGPQSGGSSGSLIEINACLAFYCYHILFGVLEVVRSRSTLRLLKAHPITNAVHCESYKVQ